MKGSHLLADGIGADIGIGCVLESVSVGVCGGGAELECTNGERKRERGGKEREREGGGRREGISQASKHNVSQ